MSELEELQDLLQMREEQVSSLLRTEARVRAQCRTKITAQTLLLERAADRLQDELDRDDPLAQEIYAFLNQD